MSLSSEIQNKIEFILSTPIRTVRPVSGGDINETYLLQTVKDNFFLKLNREGFALEIFKSEQKGLELLRSSKAIRIPKVVGLGTSKVGSFLILEYIELGSQSASFWKKFGQELAELHRSSNEYFGLDYNNFIGSLPQQNHKEDNWSHFYIRQRLLPQIEMAEKMGRIDKNTIRQFEKLFTKLPSLFPDEPPALIHGDLWNGNFLAGQQDLPYLIDPSVSYAHREMDLAMSRLFGGFDKRFYQVYEEVFPLEPGFEERVEIYQLYYLMAHVNLFGGGYLRSVQRILNRFVS